MNGALCCGLCLVSAGRSGHAAASHCLAVVPDVACHCPTMSLAPLCYGADAAAPPGLLREARPTLDNRMFELMD